MYEKKFKDRKSYGLDVRIKKATDLLSITNSVYENVMKRKNVHILKIALEFKVEGQEEKR